MPWHIQGNKDLEKGKVIFVNEDNDPKPNYRKIVLDPFTLHEKYAVTLYFDMESNHPFRNYPWPIFFVPEYDDPFPDYFQLPPETSFDPEIDESEQEESILLPPINDFMTPKELVEHLIKKEDKSIAQIKTELEEILSMRKTLEQIFDDFIEAKQIGKALDLAESFVKDAKAISEDAEKAKIFSFFEYSSENRRWDPMVIFGECLASHSLTKEALSAFKRVPPEFDMTYKLERSDSSKDDFIRARKGINEIFVSQDKFEEILEETRAICAEVHKKYHYLESDVGTIWKNLADACKKNFLARAKALENIPQSCKFYSEAMLECANLYLNVAHQAVSALEVKTEKSLSLDEEEQTEELKHLGEQVIINQEKERIKYLEKAIIFAEKCDDESLFATIFHELTNQPKQGIPLSIKIGSEAAIALAREKREHAQQLQNLNNEIDKLKNENAKLTKENAALKAQKTAPDKVGKKSGANLFGTGHRRTRSG